MRYAVIRVEDERSSEICRKIQEYADQNGGLVLPFSFDWVQVNEEDAAWNLSGAKFDRDGLGLVDNYGAVPFDGEEHYTHLFHAHCRCQLVPLSDDSDIYRGEEITEYEELIMTNSALSHSANMSIMESIVNERLQDLGVNDEVTPSSSGSLMEVLMNVNLEEAGFQLRQRTQQKMTMNRAKRKRKGR